MRLTIGLTTSFQFPFPGLVLLTSAAGVSALVAAPTVGAWTAARPQPQRRRGKEPAW